MFAFQWREFSPPLSSTHRLDCSSAWYLRQKRDRRRCNSKGNSTSALVTKVISQWESSLEWRHAVTLHILVGKICISFFLFYCEGMLSLVVLWLCGVIWYAVTTITRWSGCDTCVWGVVGRVPFIHSIPQSKNSFQESQKRLRLIENISE